MKTYKGIRQPGRSLEVLVIESILDSGLERKGRLEHRFRHSPDGFEWGYGGSGPADLAFSILWDYLGHEPAKWLYMEFKWTVVANFNRQEWSITSEEIARWLSDRRVKR